MSSRRTYSEEEIARIFELAAAKSSPDHNNRLTLEELQDIGASSGLDRAAIAAAARQLDYGVDQKPRSTFLGSDIGVSRVALLPGSLSDAAWEELVGEIRDTFGAAGKTTHEGSSSQWRNGSLQILLERTPKGDRLRMSTRRAWLYEILLVLAGALTMGIVGVVALLIFADSASGFGLPIFGILGALAGLGFSKVRQAAWANEREEQMEHIARVASELVAQPTSSPLPESAAEVEVGTLDLAEPEIEETVRRQRNRSR